jgi:hypothetical protein
MRQLLRRHLPSLADGIYGDIPPGLPAADGSGPEWVSEGAEARMQDAFERGGPEGWLKSVARELEAEKALERRKREELASTA